MVVVNPLPQSPQTPTSAMGQQFKTISVVSPVKTKFNAEEEAMLRRLVLTKDPILNSAVGLKKLLATPTFNRVPRSLASIRTKVRDLKRLLETTGGL